MRIIALAFLFLGVTTFFVNSSNLNKQKGLVYLLLAVGCLLASDESFQYYSTVGVLALGLGFLYVLFSTTLYLNTTQPEAMEELDDFDD